MNAIGGDQITQIHIHIHPKCEHAQVSTHFFVFILLFFILLAKNHTCHLYPVLVMLIFMICQFFALRLL